MSATTDTNEFGWSEKAMEVVKLRHEVKLSWRQIANELGYKDESGARHAYKRAMLKYEELNAQTCAEYVLEQKAFLRSMVSKFVIEEASLTAKEWRQRDKVRHRIAQYVGLMNDLMGVGRIEQAPQQSSGPARIRVMVKREHAAEQPAIEAKGEVVTDPATSEATEPEQPSEETRETVDKDEDSE